MVRFYCQSPVLIKIDWEEESVKILSALIACTILSGAPFVAAYAQNQLEVSDNGRYLQRETGEPFFYMGDTAWAIFHRLNKDEVDQYLTDRAEKGFTVIQAVVLSELNGIYTPNANGDMPLTDLDLAQPNEAYFKHVDYVVEKANSLGMTVGMLPSWGHYWRDGDRLIFTPENAKTFGKFLGTRYQENDVIWILGGDSNARSDAERANIEAMAMGLGAGDKGKHLITFHPRGPGQSSVQFKDAEWLDFYMNQSSHAAPNHDTGLYAEYDRSLDVVKPTLDGEPRYEGIPVGFYNKGHDPRIRFNDDDARQAAWWSVLAGAAGHTYGNNNVWQMWSPKHEPAIGANIPWSEAIEHPGARQMGYMRRFMEEHHFETLVPDQSLILDGPVHGAGKIRAARSEDGARIIAYSPRGEALTLGLNNLSSAMHKQVWFDPRYGVSYEFRNEQSHGIQSFVPPTSGKGEDWVLLLEASPKE